MADLEERLHVCLFDPRGFQALDGNSNFGRSVLGCIEADVLQLNAHFPALFSIYQMVRLLHCSELKRFANCSLFISGVIVRALRENVFAAFMFSLSFGFCLDLFSSFHW